MLIQGSDACLAYNTAHDNDLVVLAMDNLASPPAPSAIGVDIMRCTLPRGLTLNGFIYILKNQVRCCYTFDLATSDLHGL